MFKKIISILLTLAVLLSLAGCAQKTNEKQIESAMTVTDHGDNTVSIPKDIQRIVVCDIYPLPSVLSVFFDGAGKIVGMPEQSMTAAKNSLLSQLYPEILNAKTDFINGTEINTEELLALKPDIVFYSCSNAKIGEQLKGTGIPAIGISVSKWDYNCVETLNQWISLLDQIFPENEKAKTVADYSNNIYNMVQKRVSTLSDSEREKVFFLFQYSENSILTSGDNFFGDWWADAIGAKNVAKELKGDNAQPVDFEQVYNWNPQTIFITNFNKAKPETLYNNTVGAYNWSEIQAVKNKKVYKMPLGIYRSYTPGADTPITLLWLAKTTYPNLFEDIDIMSETKDYYKKVFGIDLTDDQANSIFAPVEAAGSGF